MRKKKKEIVDVDVVETTIPKIETSNNQQIKNNSDDDQKKEKNGIVKTFNMYKFIIKVVAAAILIAFGIIMWVNNGAAVFALILISGIAVALAGLIRIFGLFRKERHPKAKKILAVTCIIHMAIGAYLIFAAFIFNKDMGKVNNDIEQLTGFSKFNSTYYGVFMAAVLYVEAVSYFWQAVLYKSETGKIMFWLHIVFMTLAVVLAFLSTSQNVKANHIVIFLAVIALICALLIAGEALFGFFKYRNEVNKNAEAKEQKKEKKNDSIAPGVEDENDEEHTLIIEEPDAHDQDSIVS